MKNLSNLMILIVFALSAFTQSLSAQQNLLYGQTYNIQNGWNNNSGGYLDVNGQGCQDNHLCVSTSKAANRSGESGQWIILSTTGKKIGEPVVSGDLVSIQSVWNGNGGYLGTRGYGKDFNNPGYLCVSTYKSPDAAGSTTWKITSEEGGKLKDNSAISLQGQWNKGNGGYLDTRGYAKDYGDTPSAWLCVSTSREANRDGGSGLWKFTNNLISEPTFKSRFPMSTSTALKVDKKYFSPNKAYFLVFQSDGNLCIYKADGKVFKWGSYQQSGKFGSVAKFNRKGNLVVKDKDNQVVWTAKTDTPLSTLNLSNTGNIEIKSNKGKVLYQSK